MPSFRDNLILTVVSAILGCFFGALGSFCAAHLKIKELQRSFDLKIQEIKAQVDLQQQVERENQEINLRLRYINPLRSTTNQLINRLAQIRLKMTNEDELRRMKMWFDRIKQFCEQRTNRDENGFIIWCYYEGTFAMSTLYYTSLYFAYAVAIFTQDPFREINHRFSLAIAEHLNRVKISFAQNENHGIWQESQDNAGVALYKGDMVMSYDEFCKHLVSTSSGPNYGPFLRVIDFYREFLYAQPTSIREIGNSLASLQQFLNSSPSDQILSRSLPTVSGL